VGGPNLNSTSVATVLNVVVSYASIVGAASKIAIVFRKAQRVNSILAHSVASECEPIL